MLGIKKTNIYIQIEGDKPGNAAVNLIIHILLSLRNILLHNDDAIPQYTLLAAQKILHQLHVRKMTYTPLTRQNLNPHNPPLLPPPLPPPSQHR